jgi:hypothetical protein
MPAQARTLRGAERVQLQYASVPQVWMHGMCRPGLTVLQRVIGDLPVRRQGSQDPALRVWRPSIRFTGALDRSKA